MHLVRYVGHDIIIKDAPPSTQPRALQVENTLRINHVPYGFPKRYLNNAPPPSYPL